MGPTGPQASKLEAQELRYHCGPGPLGQLLQSWAPGAWLLNHTLSRDLRRHALRPCTNREFSQIENVDVGMNVDVEFHPVGSFTPQNVQVFVFEIVFVCDICFLFISTVF